MAELGTFDYVIVGAGSAGCILANRLSERATVLLLEAGISDLDPSVAGDILDRDGTARVVFLRPGISRAYMTQAQVGLAQRQVGIHRGIVLGGCSSINAMVYIRGNRHDYDQWAQLGCPGWSYEEVLPYFKRSEDYAGPVSAHHVSGGPLSVRPLPNPSPAALAFVEAAAAAGFPDSRPDWDFNGARQEDAAGIYQLTLSRQDQRASAAAAFLRPAADRAGLTVRTGASATRVAIEGGRATGVRVRADGSEHIYRASREVILAAGAFESPKLLMLSGIGPAEQLRALGITPLVDLPGVGQNLHDHIQTLVYYPAGPGAGIRHVLAEAGLFTNTIDHSGAASPNLQYHFLAGNPDLVLNPETKPHFIAAPVACKPLSRGNLSLRSTDPAAAPLIQPNYLECEADVEVLLRGMELADEIAHTAPLAGLTSGEPPFGLAAQGAPPVALGRSPAERRDFIAQFSGTVWHPVGTCKMGLDRMAVVDPHLRVYGVQGLRVADASIMPVITAGNTNAPCIMIGEKAADLISG